MIFDFDKFANITARVFPDDVGYSLGDALSVFKYYFERYEEHTCLLYTSDAADE